MNNNENFSPEEIIKSVNEQIKNLYKHTCSVSKMCNFLKPVFDDVGMAEHCAKKGLEDPDYKYAGMTAEQILESWHEKSDTSKKYGSLLDTYAGMFFNKKDKEMSKWKKEHDFDNDERLHSTCQGINDFYEWLTANTPYRYVTRELPVYCRSDNNQCINGRFDCLFYNEETNSYIIIDWKTTDDITTKNVYKNYLLGPAYELDECDMNIYTIQLHIYKKALVETYRLTSYDRISVYVCNLLKAPNENGKFFKLYKQNFDYNPEFLNKCIDYANKKL